MCSSRGTRTATRSGETWSGSYRSATTSTTRRCRSSTPPSGSSTSPDGPARVFPVAAPPKVPWEAMALHDLWSWAPFFVVQRRNGMKVKLEYIWLDGYEPVPNLRSKTKIVDFEGEPTLDRLPVWNFDGSSTRQAEGSSSDCLLQPVALFPDPARANGYLVMCEVLLPDGTPHPSNSRATIPDDPGTWFGFEQEYFLYRDGAPLGFPKEGFPAPQGEYYTGVGYKNVGDVARAIVDEHIDLCLAAGINL